MDWADDIAYAVHDVEDFFRAGLVPLDDYKRRKKRLDEFFNYCEQHFGNISAELRAAVEGVLALGPTSAYAGTTADLHALQQLRGTLLSQFISNARIEDGRLVINGLVREVNSILKQMIWYHIIDDPKLFHIQHGQRRVLGETFEHVRLVVSEAYEAGEGMEMGARMMRRLPPVLRHTLQLAMADDPSSPYTMEQRLMRATLDYISSLSDAEIYQVHAVMNGRESYGRLG